MLQTDLKERPRRSLRLLGFRSAVSGRPRFDRCAVGRAQGRAAAPAQGQRQDRANSLCRAFRRRRPGDFQACLRDASRGHCVEAARRALSLRGGRRISSKPNATTRRNSSLPAFRPSTALPKAVGALTVAFHENGKLRYAGRVGTGYTRETARDLWQRLRAAADRSPARHLAQGRAAQGRHLGEAANGRRDRIPRRHP